MESRECLWAFLLRRNEASQPSERDLLSGVADGSGFLSVCAAGDVVRPTVSPGAAWVRSFGGLPVRQEKTKGGIDVW